MMMSVRYGEKPGIICYQAVAACYQFQCQFAFPVAALPVSSTPVPNTSINAVLRSAFGQGMSQKVLQFIGQQLVRYR